MSTFILLIIITAAVAFYLYGVLQIERMCKDKFIRLAKHYLESHQESSNKRQEKDKKFVGLLLATLDHEHGVHAVEYAVNRSYEDSKNDVHASGQSISNEMKDMIAYYCFGIMASQPRKFAFLLQKVLAASRTSRTRNEINSWLKKHECSA